MCKQFISCSLECKLATDGAEGCLAALTLEVFLVLHTLLIFALCESPHNGFYFN